MFIARWLGTDSKHDHVSFIFGNSHAQSLVCDQYAPHRHISNIVIIFSLYHYCFVLSDPSYVQVMFSLYDWYTLFTSLKHCATRSQQTSKQNIMYYNELVHVYLAVSVCSLHAHFMFSLYLVMFSLIMVYNFSLFFCPYMGSVLIGSPSTRVFHPTAWMLIHPRAGIHSDACTYGIYSNACTSHMPSTAACAFLRACAFILNNTTHAMNAQ